MAEQTHSERTTASVGRQEASTDAGIVGQERRRAGTTMAVSTTARISDPRGHEPSVRRPNTGCGPGSSAVRYRAVEDVLIAPLPVRELLDLGDVPLAIARQVVLVVADLLVKLPSLGPL